MGNTLYVPVHPVHSTVPAQPVSHILVVRDQNGHQSQISVSKIFIYFVIFIDNWGNEI